MGIGEFETEVFRVPVGFGSRKLEFGFGKLPGLLSVLLDSFKADGIIGYQLFEKGQTYLSFKEKKLYWRGFMDSPSS